MTDIPTSAALATASPEMDLAAYNQNSETFRTLNALMWQVPLIAMTLTGGLWFGVSSIPNTPELSWLRPALLMLAGIGDLLLIVILQRLRFLLREYLGWLQKANPTAFVAADGSRWWNKKEVVKTCFQIMLGFAAFTSIVLSVRTVATIVQDPPGSKPRSAAAWYDQHAKELADGYEGLNASETHPQLFRMLAGAKGVRILDVGAGTGRDASALAQLEHQVTAVDPSGKMLRLARALHPGNDVRWLQDAMPQLGKVSGTYDVVLLSGVWMHVAPVDRPKALSRLVDLTAPGGRIYMTLRLGPGDVERAMWSVSAEEVARLAKARGLSVTDLGKQPDLLGRDDISWQTLVLRRP